MTCRQFESLIDDAIADALCTGRAQEFEQHRMTCPSCQKYFTAYRECIWLAKSVVGPMLDEEIQPAPTELILAIVNAQRDARYCGKA